MSSTSKTTSTTKTAQNRGPVTTSFAPSKSCIATTTTGTSRTNSGVYLNVGHWDGGESGGCYPTAKVASTSWNWDYYYYSPAVCPSDWQTVASLTSILSGPAMGPGTSGYLCCPSGYASKANAARDHQCSRTLTSGFVLTNVYSDGAATRTASNLTLTAATTVNCDGIPVVWQTTDVAVLKIIGSTELIPASLLTTTKTGTTTRATTLSTGNGGTSTSGATPTGTSEAPGSSLGTGAKAGIAVGTIGAVAIMLAGLFFFFLRRRRNAKSKPTLDTDDKGQGLLTSGSHSPKEPQEMFSDMKSNLNPQEMPVKEPTHELNDAASSIHPHYGAGEVYEMGPSSRRDAPEDDDIRSEFSRQSYPQPLGPPLSSPGLVVVDKKAEEKLAALKERMERIRQDKERLTQIQELTELEERTKAEIEEAQKGRDRVTQIQELTELEERTKVEILEAQKKTLI